MKKIFSLLTLLIGGSVLLAISSLIGCEARDYKFVYKSVQATVLRVHFTQPPSEINSLDTIGYQNIFIQGKFDMHIIAKNNLKTLVNRAVATTVPSDKYTNLEAITDIRVVTINDYNNEISAGSEISEKCLYSTYTPNKTSEIKDLKADIIASLNMPMDGERDYLSDVLNFRVTEAPAAQGLQQFAIEIRLEDNSVIRDTTVAFVLKP